jgi:hypothetical protein
MKSLFMTWRGLSFSGGSASVMGTNIAGGDSDDKMASKIYDRSIRLWGKDSQQRIISAKVLVVGLRSLSAEICKNLVLAGTPRRPSPRSAAGSGAAEPVTESRWGGCVQASSM